MKNIHKITDNAFSKAWEVNCPNCKAENPNRILWFRKKCNNCVTKDMAERMYSEEDMRKAIFTSFLLGVDRGNYSKELEDKLIEQFKKGGNNE